ncbi:AMP-binding protein [Streptomyces sp. SS]|uniref:AMP-binding protein n=1 Tax=Streptomyces sp. SS TaxID=260742 RepID=UPI000305CA9F
MLNLAALLENSARTVPDRTAVVLGTQRLTYAELDTAARRVADLLCSRGIQPGDKVALSCPNLPWFPIVYYGILKAGGVVVPLNVLLKGREIAYHLADSEAKAYFCFEGTVDLPMGQEGWAGFGETPGCEDFFLMTAAPTAVSPIEGAETLTAALAGQSADFETVVTESGDTAVILYTSGTTGRPKGAELTHSNVMLNVLTCHKLFGEIERSSIPSARSSR